MVKQLRYKTGDLAKVKFQGCLNGCCSDFSGLIRSIFCCWRFKKTHFFPMFTAIFDGTTIFGWVFTAFFLEKGLLRGQDYVCISACRMPEAHWGEMALTTHNGNTGVSGTRGGKGQDVDGRAVNGAQGLLQKHHRPDSPKFAKNKHIP